MSIPALNKVDHIHIYVDDRDAAEVWYRDVLGFKRIPKFEHWAVGGGPLTLANDSATVHIALFKRPPQPNRAVIAFGVTADALIAWQTHLGSALGAAPPIIDHQGAWSLYFSDPDGNPYEITSYEDPYKT